MYSGAAKIVFKTVDISELVQAVATSVGAIVIDSDKGDVDQPKLITNIAQFIEEYGQPAVDDYPMHAAIGFLNNATRLYCMRAHKDALYGGIEIKSAGSPEVNAAWAAGVADPTTRPFGVDGLFTVFQKNPGAWGDNISVKVEISDVASHLLTISVYYTEGGSTTLVESWDVSRVRQVDGYGEQMYMEDRINGASQYIRVLDNTVVADTTLCNEQLVALAMDGGSNGSAVTSSELVTAWDKFADKNSYSVNILINGGFTDVTVQQKMLTIAEARVDCTCVLDAPYADLDSVTDLVTWRNTTQNFNSSFAALYSPWIKIFDEYNGQIISIPPSGDIAGVYAYTDNIYGAAHGAPAGYNRGGLTRALSLSFGSTLTKKAYTEGEMDTLDDAQINSILADPGYGILVYGEETEQTTRSALSNVHVRRMINQMAVQTTRLCKTYLFEPLIERTYFRVRTVLEQYMGEMEGLGAFDNVDGRGWKVVCDATNNPASARDNNELHVWLFVKPVRVAKYIEIKAIITRSTASFEAIVAAGIPS